MAEGTRGVAEVHLALRSDDVLEPRKRAVARDWRLRCVEPFRVPDVFHTDVDVHGDRGVEDDFTGTHPVSVSIQTRGMLSAPDDDGLFLLQAIQVSSRLAARRIDAGSLVNRPDRDPVVVVTRVVIGRAAGIGEGNFMPCDLLIVPGSRDRWPA